MRAQVLALVVAVFVVGATSACRQQLPLSLDAAPGEAADMAFAAIDCRADKDCLTCCSATLQSGALAFTAAVQQCACQAATCKSACRQTVCGAALGVDSACKSCLDGLLVDGGACAEPVRECVETEGACGAWQHCVDAC